MKILEQFSLQESLKVEIKEIISLFKRWTKKNMDQYSFNLNYNKPKNNLKKKKIKLTRSSSRKNKFLFKNNLINNNSNDYLKKLGFFSKINKYLYKFLSKKKEKFLFKNIIEMSNYIFERNRLIIGKDFKINIKKYMTGNYDNIIKELKRIKKKYKFFKKDIKDNGIDEFIESSNKRYEKLKEFFKNKEIDFDKKELSVLKIKNFNRINFKGFINNEKIKTKNYTNIKFKHWIILLYELFFTHFNLIIKIFIIVYIINNGGLWNIILIIYFFMIMEINHYNTIYNWGFLYIYLSLLIILKNIISFIEKKEIILEYLINLFIGKNSEILDYFLITTILFQVIIIDIKGISLNVKEFENINETFLRIKFNKLIKPLLNNNITENFDNIKDYFLNDFIKTKEKKIKSLLQLEKEENQEYMFRTFNSMTNYYILNLDTKKYVNGLFQKTFSPFNPKKGEDYSIILYIVYFILLIYCFIFGHKLIKFDFNFYEQINQNVIFFNQILLVCYYLFIMIFDKYLLKINNKSFRYYTVGNNNKFLYPERENEYYNKLSQLIDNNNIDNWDINDFKINQNFRYLEINDVKKRNIYKKNPLFYRYIFHIINLFILLLVCFILFPLTYNNYQVNKDFQQFYDLIYLKVFLFINFIYFFIIFKQIKNGYRIIEISKQDKMNDVYSFKGKIIAYGLIFIRSITLLSILNTVFDFLFTKTSLNLKNWILIDTIEDNLFKTTLLQLGGEEKILMGFKYKRIVKFIIGFFFTLIFWFIFLGPLLLFINIFSNVNKVNEVCYSSFLNCKKVLILFENECKRSSSEITDLDYNSIDNIKKFGKKYIYKQNFFNISNKKFLINKEIITSIKNIFENEGKDKKNCNLEINFEFKMEDSSNKKLKKNIEFDNNQTEQFKKLILLLNKFEEDLKDSNSNKNKLFTDLKTNFESNKINLKNNLSFIINLKNKSNTASIIGNFNKEFSLKLNLITDIFNNESLYWGIDLSKNNENNGENNGENFFYIYTVSEILIEIFNLFKGLTIISLYTSLVITLIGKLNEFFNEDPEKIWLKWSPCSEKILKITYGIKNSQYNMDLYKEKKLFFTLIDIIRSPEFILYLTNEVKKYVQYINKNKIQRDAYKLKKIKSNEKKIKKKKKRLTYNH